MAKHKLERFAQMATFSNVIQPTLNEVLNKDYSLKGRWNELFFKNNNPIVLELGCGKGEYTVGLAQRFPDKNFLGLDIKGARMWRGAATAIEENITNAGFLRTRIEHICSYFAPGEISEIWVTFCDPQVRKAQKRLTSSVFLNRYKKFLKTDGLVHLKTDNTMLHAYTKLLCEQNGLDIKYNTTDLYHSGFDNEALLSIKTHYEGLFHAKGETIKYIYFSMEKCEKLHELSDDDEQEIRKLF